MLANRDIDIAPADFTITMERSRVVDYLPGLTSSYQMLFIKNPAETMNWKAYIEPFARETWLAILAFIFVVPIVIFGMISYGSIARIMYKIVKLWQINKYQNSSKFSLT